MILSRKWLEDYVDTKDISDKEFCDAMTLSGSKVEEFNVEGSELENIVVGKINSLERHPDSDHLWICSVDVGKGEDYQIVTGAQNLSVGDYVPAALPGATVYNRKEHCLEKIKKGKLRGIESNGMLCSFDELGLTQNDFRTPALTVYSFLVMTASTHRGLIFTKPSATMTHALNLR